MEYISTFATEELIIMLSVAGFDEEAKSLLDSTSITTGAKELEVLYNSIVTQLKIKGIWDIEKEKKGVNPLADEVISFLKIYAKSRFLIRMTNGKQKNMLVLHYINYDKWLYHFIENNSIHHFSFISEKKIQKYIKEYYNIPIKWNNIPNLNFTLTDQQFDLLKNPKNTKKIKKDLHGSDREIEAYSLFEQDLAAQEFEMDNISVFYISNQKELFLENIGFILLSTQGIWLTQYKTNSFRPISIEFAGEQEWEQFLNNVYLFTAEIINKRIVLNN